MIDIGWNGLRAVIDTGPEAPVLLLHFSAAPYDAAAVADADRWAYRLVEIKCAGMDHDYVASGRYAGSGLGGRLRYLSHTDEEDGTGRHLAITQRDPASGLIAVSHLHFAPGLPLAESWTEIRNDGDRTLTITALSSFHLCGVTKESGTPAPVPAPGRAARATLWHAHQSWYSEFQWSRASLCQHGLENNFAFGSKHVGAQSTGTWCTANYLPMGFLENSETGCGHLWEILHHGSWSWQVGDVAKQLYLHLAGPTENESQWWLPLAPGERFESVHAAVAVTRSGFDAALAAMTRYRRQVRVAPLGGQPVVFNDYMNCLMGDPSEERVMPLIDGAAALGAEVYCMDAGWYAAPGTRWSASLGEWTPNLERFPRGLKPVMDYIREKGMIAGLWFEIEVMTATCPGFAELPDDWFLVRHGERWVNHRRHLLDFRNPQVRAFADAAIAYAVEELGCGYLKIDYNVGSDAGPDAEGGGSPGQALMEHGEALLAWHDALRSRYPSLLIEHCASGGMRVTQPFLARFGNASNSDQGDPLHVARIAAASPTAIPPEQNGTWALPRAVDDAERIAFAMLCALPQRMIVAGEAARLTEWQRALVAEAVALNKQLRGFIAESVPFWPLGLPAYHDPWVVLGLRRDDEVLLAVWRRTGGDERLEITLPAPARSCEVLYPDFGRDGVETRAATVTVALREYAGRLLRCRLSEREAIPGP